MDNFAIADNFSLLAKLIDIHGDNSFKAKSYAAAAFAIEKLPTQLSALPAQKIASLKGIGNSTAKKIAEQMETGRLTELDNYLIKTPVGIIEMMRIKGLGPKKISTIWKELEVETVGELLYACNENRLTMYKGFGQKTQQNIKDTIEYYLNNQGNFLYAQVEETAQTLTRQWQHQFGYEFILTGDARRHAEVIYRLEWVTDMPLPDLKQHFDENGFTTEVADEYLSAKGQDHIALHFYCTVKDQLQNRLFATTGSAEFMAAFSEQFPGALIKNLKHEDQVFADCKLQVIPPFLRETTGILTMAGTGLLPPVIEVPDVKGIIHTHSNWSDGTNTIEEMASAAMEQGFEYLVISDHSKSAFYANGLYPERLVQQHQLIDELNARLAPFRIFKSIESDILNDGSLDYDESVLAGFDLVIASVHSNLKMPKEKATERLLKAIRNKYTTILGHMTGRLLLSRAGYEVDHEVIIDACAKHQVVIELNAHPRRLDMDWRWINNAVEKNVLISIDPDAHSINGYNDIRYGVLSAQKAGLMPHQNLSSFTLLQFEQFLQQQRQKR